MTKRASIAPRIRRTPIGDRAPVGLAASVVLSAALLTTVAVAGVGSAAPRAAADLRVLFRPLVGSERARANPREETPPPIVGRSGSVCRVAFTILNTGTEDAYAVVVDAYTALGPTGVARRFQPGPGAGRRVEGALDLPLFVGMRELCLKARLQTVTDDEIGDPHPRDNQVCRSVVVYPASDSGLLVEGCPPEKRDL